MMKSEDVKQLAIKSISAIRAEREHQTEETIKNRMLRKRFYFFGPFPTRDEAIKLLDRETDLFGWRSRFMLMVEERLKQLITLSELSVEVFVDEDNASDLKCWEYIPRRS